MSHKSKTRKQLISELMEFHERVRKLEASDGMRKKAEEDLRKSKGKIEQLHKSALQMAITRTKENAYQITLGSAQKILDFDIASVLMVSGDQIRIQATTDKTAPSNAQMSISEGICGRTYRNGKSYLIEDVTKDKDAKPTNNEYRSTISVPIGNRGVFQAHSTKLNDFDQEDLKLAELLISYLEAILGRIDGETALSHRQAVLEAVSFCAEKLLRTANWEKIAKEVLERLGVAVNVDRTYLFKNQQAKDGKTITSY